MSKELVIGSNRHETKVAVLEDDQLVEIYFQRANEYSLAGSIHKGRVTRVLPGMQSAFVDLGLERDTFLYVSDFFDEHDDIDTVVDDQPAVRRERGERRVRSERSGNRSGGERGSEERALSDLKQQPIAAPAEVQSDALIDESTPAAALRFDEELDLPAAEPLDAEAETPDSDLEAGLSSNVAIAPSRTSDTERTGNRGERGAGGDRDRRHRRRRNRGRGFPETKYAHPGDDSRTPGGAGPGERGPRRDREPAGRNTDQNASSSSRNNAPNINALNDVRNDETGETSSFGVMLLPGESLAKYRRMPAVKAEESSAHESAPDEEVHELVREAVSAEEPNESPEDLGAEAEEIAMADRIFGHNDGESTEDVEEKIEDAADDLPRDELPQEDSQSGLEELEATGQSLAVPFEPQAGVEAAILLEDAEPLTTFGARSPSPFGKPGENDPGSEAGLEPGEQAGEPDLFSPETAGFEDDGMEEPDALQKGDVEPEPAPGTAQTAEVREGSQNRPLHRSSRRMRRRRGGHRPERQANDASAAGGGDAVAAAPAVETETKNHRSSDEERTSDVDKPERTMPSISDLLKSGQEIIVQIAKEPLGQKGARITSHVALPGRYVVFMPSVQHLGVSRKIASDEERQRLKHILQTHRSGATGGFIVRTAGEGVSEEELAADMSFLYNQWLDIRQKAEKKPAPALLHYDLDIVQRILRDQVTSDFKAIWIDSEDMYENVLTFMQRFQPSLVNRVKMYTRPGPIFDAFNITAELEKALRPKVWLKSGGYIVINQTEALVAIDINTGKYVGKSNRLEDTIVKTNTEAVKEIVRQIRLRDLGGIIVVDFIDMDERKNRQKVMTALEEAMRADKAPYKILQFNDFGLVAITRKRVKQSLERTLCSPCLYCEGAGYVKSVQTIIGEILTEAQKLSRAMEGKDVLLRVHPEVAKTLKAGSNKYLDELEEILGCPVLVKGDPTLHTEKFDLA